MIKSNEVEGEKVPFCQCHLMAKLISICHRLYSVWIGWWTCALRFQVLNALRLTYHRASIAPTVIKYKERKRQKIRQFKSGWFMVYCVRNRPKCEFTIYKVASIELDMKMRKWINRYYIMYPRQLTGKVSG